MHKVSIETIARIAGDLIASGRFTTPEYAVRTAMEVARAVEQAARDNHVTAVNALMEANR
jgi:hypothetical protein